MSLRSCIVVSRSCNGFKKISPSNTDSFYDQAQAMYCDCEDARYDLAGRVEEERTIMKESQGDMECGAIESFTLQADGRIEQASIATEKAAHNVFVQASLRGSSYHLRATRRNKNSRAT